LKKWPQASARRTPIIGARNRREVAVSLNRYGDGLMNWVTEVVMPMVHMKMMRRKIEPIRISTGFYSIPQLD
jgi:hypothetical protein